MSSDQDCCNEVVWDRYWLIMFCFFGDMYRMTNLYIYMTVTEIALNDNLTKAVSVAGHHLGLFSVSKGVGGE